MKGRLLVIILSVLLPVGMDVEAARKKHKVSYRNIANVKAYNPVSSGQHITLKVTPPVKKGPGEFVYVEIYNNTRTGIANIGFDIVLYNRSGYDLTSHIEADAIMRGRSGVRKIAVPGKGVFPPVNKVRIGALRIINDDATEVVARIYVDLIRVHKSRNVRKVQKRQ